METYGELILAGICTALTVGIVMGVFAGPLRQYLEVWFLGMFG